MVDYHDRVRGKEDVGSKRDVLDWSLGRVRRLSHCRLLLLREAAVVAQQDDYAAALQARRRAKRRLARVVSVAPAGTTASRICRVLSARERGPKFCACSERADKRLQVRREALTRQ
eukprot:4027700-Pleurochrysis_carterae.AAC.3